MLVPMKTAVSLLVAVGCTVWIGTTGFVDNVGMVGMGMVAESNVFGGSETVPLVGTGDAVGEGAEDGVSSEVGIPLVTSVLAGGGELVTLPVGTYPEVEGGTMPEVDGRASVGVAVPEPVEDGRGGRMPVPVEDGTGGRIPVPVEDGMGGRIPVPVEDRMGGKIPVEVPGIGISVVGRPGRLRLVEGTIGGRLVSESKVLKSGIPVEGIKGTDVGRRGGSDVGRLEGRLPVPVGNRSVGSGSKEDKKEGRSRGSLLPSDVGIGLDVGSGWSDPLVPIAVVIPTIMPPVVVGCTLGGSSDVDLGSFVGRTRLPGRPPVEPVGSRLVGRRSVGKMPVGRLIRPSLDVDDGGTTVSGTPPVEPGMINGPVIVEEASDDSGGLDELGGTTSSGTPPVEAALDEGLGASADEDGLTMISGISPVDVGWTTVGGTPPVDPFLSSDVVSELAGAGGDSGA